MKDEAAGGYDKGQEAIPGFPGVEARARLIPALAAVAAMALAGCSGGPGIPAGIPLDAGGDPLPTLHGIVVDEAIRPLPGALVRFLGEDDVSAVTDEVGEYAIHEPTGRAHAVLVSASKPGFLPRTQQVQVSGHLSAKLGFVLEADPSVVPRVDVLQERGSLGCRATVAAYPGGFDCSPCLYDCDFADSEYMWPINPTPGLAGVVVEVHWEALTPASAHLTAAVRAPVLGGPDGSFGEVVAEATGTSPLVLQIPEDVARAMPRWSAIYLLVGLADDQGDVPAGLAQDQSFDAFASLFYVDPAPPGYRLP